MYFFEIFQEFFLLNFFKSDERSHESSIIFFINLSAVEIEKMFFLIQRDVFLFRYIMKKCISFLWILQKKTSIEIL